MDNVLWKKKIGISTVETECVDFIESSFSNTIYVLGKIIQGAHNSIIVLRISSDGQTILWRCKLIHDENLFPVSILEAESGNIVIVSINGGLVSRHIISLTPDGSLINAS